MQGFEEIRVPETYGMETGSSVMHMDIGGDLMGAPLVANMVDGDGMEGDPLIAGMRAYAEMVVEQKAVGPVCEWLFGCERKHEFSVYNEHGANGREMLFRVKEDSGCFCRVACGTMRGLEISVCAEDGKEIIRLVKPFLCAKCGCLCGLMPCCCSEGAFSEIRVYSGRDCTLPNVILGIVHEECRCSKARFCVYDAHGNDVYWITSDKGMCCNCINVDFSVHHASKLGAKVGSIKKTTQGCLREFFTDADNFRVKFPIDATGTQRLLLLAAVFLIDFTFFENNYPGSLRP